MNLQQKYKELKEKELKTYIVKITGSDYDEVYSENEYVGFSKETAEMYINKSKGRTLINKGMLYAYLQTWLNGVKIEEKEVEL